MHLAEIGRLEEDMAHAKQALELDPRDPAPPGHQPGRLLCRRFDQALRAEKEAMQFKSNLGNHHLFR